MSAEDDDRVDPSTVLVPLLVEMQNVLVDIKELLVQAKPTSMTEDGFDGGRGASGHYYDTGLATISIATPTLPANFDIIAAPGRQGYDTHPIFSILGRVAPALIVANEPGSPLYVVVTSDGHSWGGEIVIEQGEARTFYDVWELRLRSPLANTQYRITEFEILKSVNIEFFKGNPYISETLITNLGLANANIEDIANGASIINGAARDDTYQCIRRNAHSGELANLGPGNIFAAFDDGMGYSNERTIPPNNSQDLGGMDIAMLRLRTDVINTQYRLAAQ